MFTISVRMKTSEEVTKSPTIRVSKTVLPPVKMSLDKARLENKQEDHFIISFLTPEDILRIATIFQEKVNDLRIDGVLE